MQDFFFVFLFRALTGVLMTLCFTKRQLNVVHGKSTLRHALRQRLRSLIDFDCWIESLQNVFQLQPSQLPEAKRVNRRLAICLEQLEVRAMMACDMRVVTYNVHSGTSPDFSQIGTLLQAMGNESVVSGIGNGSTTASCSRPIDVLALQEINTQATTTASIVNQLNTIYGAGAYSRGSLNGVALGGASDTVGLIFRTATVQLQSEFGIGTPSVSGQARQTIRYELRNVSSGLDFYLYNSHYKASNTNADEARRLVEAQAIRTNADLLGQGASIIYAGDFNIYSSSETPYQHLLSSGAGQAFDPINRPGSWSNNASFRDIFTQAPSNNPPPGFTNGGLDDRFDFQLLTGEWTDGVGLDYASSSYRVFGNNGSVALNGNINDASNTSFTGVANRLTLLNLLTTVSDHLPVVVDYNWIGASNTAPTDIAISSTSVMENLVAGTTVGILSSTDPNAGNTFTYTLVTGTGSTDNASFTIDGSGNLKTAAAFNFEAKNSYSIRVRTTDQGGLSFEKAFTVSVLNVNEVPTDITLSNASISDIAGANASVGTLTSTDPDASNTFTYTLVTGTGSTNNGLFNLSGSTLRATANVPAGTYSVRVRTTDQGGLFFEKAFTITAGSTNSAPTDIALSSTLIAENAGANATVGIFSTVDPNAGNSFIYTLVTGTGSTDNAAFSVSGNTLVAVASFDFETKSSFSIRVRTTDQGGLFFERQFTIAVTNVFEASTLFVSSFTPTNTGFVAKFSQPLVSADLNLYGNALGVADVTVEGATSGIIRGSLILNAAGDQATFVRTQSGTTTVSASGVLPNDTYTVTLRSASNGFRNATSGLLDGNNDGTLGDNYVTSFTQNVAAGAVTVSVPDFARGHGQSVNVPNTATGLPLNISTGQNVSSLQLTLNYDPSLLSISGFTLNPTLSASGVQATPNVTLPGQVILDITSSTELSSIAGALNLGSFTATIPSTAIYSAKQVLDIKDLVVFDNDPSIPNERVSMDDDAVHVAAYLGDASGNRLIQSNDGTLIARFNALLDNGFTAYQLADPIIIADISGNNQLQSNDGTLLARYNALISTPQIPTIPVPPSPLPAVGIDPILAIGNIHGAAGSTVTAPLTLTVPATEVAVGGVSGFTVLLSIDNSKLSFDSLSGFSTVGTSAAGFSAISRAYTTGSTTTWMIDVTGGVKQTQGIAPGESIVLGNLSFSIFANATGVADLNLLGSYSSATTAVFNERFQNLLLLDAFGNPAPTDGLDPSNDGLITIAGRTQASDNSRDNLLIVPAPTAGFDSNVDGLANVVNPTTTRAKTQTASISLPSAVPLNEISAANEYAGSSERVRDSLYREFGISERSELVSRLELPFGGFGINDAMIDSISNAAEVSNRDSSLRKLRRSELGNTGTEESNSIGEREAFADLDLWI